MSPAFTPFCKGLLNRLKPENKSERTPVPHALFEEHELQPLCLSALMVIESRVISITSKSSFIF